MCTVQYFVIQFTFLVATLLGLRYDNLILNEYMMIQHQAHSWNEIYLLIQRLHYMQVNYGCIRFWPRLSSSSILSFLANSAKSGKITGQIPDLANFSTAAVHANHFQLELKVMKLPVLSACHHLTDLKLYEYKCSLDIFC